MCQHSSRQARGFPIFRIQPQGLRKLGQGFRVLPAFFCVPSEQNISPAGDLTGFLVRIDGFDLLLYRFLTSSDGNLCLIFRLGLGEERHDREHDSNHQSDGDGPKRDPLAACCRFVTGDDVLCLQRCRLWFPLSGRLREPLLGGSQVVSAQDEAVVLTFVFPLDGERK